MLIKINAQALLNQVVYHSSYSVSKKMNAEELLDFEKRISAFKTQAQALNSSANEKTPQNLNNTKILNELEKGLVDVYFSDLDNKIYKVKLSFNSIAILEKKFDDILARDDNSFLLHGESAAFVSGWYKDIAMRRNYIKADENQDGFINQEEALNLRQDFNPKQFFLCIDEGVFNFKFAGLNQYAHLKDSENFKTTTLNLALNESIKLDDDFDGVINYEQASKGRADKNLGDLARKILDENKILEFLLNDEKFREKYKAKITQMLKKRAEDELKLKEDEENNKKEKIRNKILNNGIENLSEEEKIFAQKNFPQLMQKKIFELKDDEILTLLNDFLKIEKIEQAQELLNLKI